MFVSKGFFRKPEARAKEHYPKRHHGAGYGRITYKPEANIGKRPIRVPPSGVSRRTPLYRHAASSREMYLHR
jgi:hypothetical protein